MEEKHKKRQHRWIRVIAVGMAIVPLSSCLAGQTPGGVGVAEGIPFFEFKLCPGETITHLEIYKNSDDSQIWEATLESGSQGTTQLTWGFPDGYDVTGESADDVPHDETLYAEAQGGDDRELGRWTFRIDQLRDGELLLPSLKQEYMSQSDLDNQSGVDC